MIEQAVQTVLKANAGVLAIVAAARVHLAERPQKYTLPAIVIERGLNNRIPKLKGPTGTDTGFITVTGLASSYLGAKDIMRAVNTALDGYTGTVTVKDAAGDDRTVEITRMRHDGEEDTPSDHRDGQGKILTHGRSVDFRFTAITT